MSTGHVRQHSDYHVKIGVPLTCNVYRNTDKDIETGAFIW